MSTGRIRENENKKPRRPDRLLILLRILLLTAAGLAILLVVLKFEDIREYGFAEAFFGPTEPDSLSRAETLDFTPHTLNAYSAGDDGLFVLSPSGAYMVDYRDERVLDISKTFRNPAISTNGNYRLAYDAGGTNMLFKQKGLQEREIVQSEPIIFAAVNAKGVYLVITDEGGSKAAATLYANDGSERFKLYSSKRYLLGGDVYPDGNRIVLAAANQESARIVSSVMLFDVTENKSEPVAVRDVLDHLVLEVRCISADRVLALCEHEAILLDAKTGEDIAVIPYEGASLLGFTSGNGFFALRLSRSGSDSFVETYNYDGDSLGSLSMRGVVSMDAADGFLGILTNDSFMVYNSKLENEAGGSTIGGARRLIMRGGRKALILTSQSAAGYEF